MTLNPFVPNGRIPRRVYIPAALVLNFVFSATLEAGSDALALFAFLLLWPIAMLTIQRAHDIGKPTWFAVLWLVLGSIAGVLSEAGDLSGLIVLVWIASAIPAIVLGFMLAFRRGDIGENEFGVDPLDPIGSKASDFV